VACRFPASGFFRALARPDLNLAFLACYQLLKLAITVGLFEASCYRAKYHVRQLNQIVLFHFPGLDAADADLIVIELLFQEAPKLTVKVIAAGTVKSNPCIVQFTSAHVQEQPTGAFIKR
jgi:hypothetical protein